MQFVYPGFLIAALAIAIPIIIHLFYFRRFKKVYFTNVRFLKEVKEETSARRRLRNLLVLLARILAILALVMAFAQPFIPEKEETEVGPRSVSVFIDNSFSMSGLSQDVVLLEKAKRGAAEIVSAYTVEDRFQILTHDFEGRHQQLVSQEDAISLINEIQVTPAVRPLNNVIERQKQALNSGNSDLQTAYLISDFQKNITDLEAFQDTSLDLNLIPLQAVRENNISIDSAWFVAPVQMLNQTNTLVVQVTNHSNDKVDNVRLALQHEGQTKPVGSLEIPAGQSVKDTVNITLLRPGWHQAKISITDYPINFDDNYFFAFHVAEKIKVLVINDEKENRFLKAVFGSVPYFELTEASANNLSYSEFPNFNLIVLNDLKNISSGLAFELNQYVENAGNLLVFPGVNAEIETYKSFLDGFAANQLVTLDRIQRNVSEVNTSEFVFFDVFENKSANLKLPFTTVNFKLTNFSNRGEEALLTYRDGSTYLGKYKKDKGHLYLCAAPLSEEYNDLVKNAEIFVPMVYKMAISSNQDNRIAYLIGKDEVLKTESRQAQGDLVYRLKGEKNEFIPSKRVIGNKVYLGVTGSIREAGFYDLFTSKEEPFYKYAFNFDRRESELDCFNASALEEAASGKVAVIDGDVGSGLTNVISQKSLGRQLWRWCLVLALVFLAIETILLRFWKV